MTEPLEAGRELDALVAEKVMGLESKIDEGYAVPTQVFSRAADLGIPGKWWGGAPAYSTEIAAAWTVVDRLFELRWQVNIWCEAPNTLGIPKWHVMLKPFGAPLKWKTVGRTAPEAICRAALRAVQPEDLPMQRLPIGEPGQFLR